MIRPAAKANTMRVVGRDQLAAAILCVPRDVPVKIVLERKDKKPLVYQFDYAFKKPLPVPGRGGKVEDPAVLKARHTNRVNERVHCIASNIRKLPRELFE